MKKASIALIVSALATASANAATVFNQDGTTVDVSGSVRLLLQKETDKRTDLKDTGSRLTFDARHNLTDGLNTLAQAQLRFSDVGIGDQMKVARLFAGFDYEKVGTLTFGKQLTIGDDIGLSDYTYDLGGVNQLITSGDKVIHFKSADFNGFRFGADYIFDESPNKREITGEKNINNYGYVFGALYNNTIGDFGIGLAVGYSSKKIGNSMLAVNERTWTAGGELSYKQFAIAVDYSRAKSGNFATMTWRDQKHPSGNQKDDVFKRIREIELGLKYQFIPQSKIYADAIWGKAVSTNERTVRLRAYIMGVDYQLHKNVLAYLEGGTFKFKPQDALDPIVKDKKVGVGLRVFF
ncbi:porin [Pasteurella canis]|uniref:Outer membrane protein P2 n=1 Tax=Pasteurella canis TaxID=753 RepID=A0ABQ4VL10_9PAST|nr:porin [Pasteurella canis]UEC23645.1 porin [Pasteurella canis]GJH43568.1 outer membrane protein P2 [Pasteurella canis]